MGCCESKDDPYNYHFEHPLKSLRESKLTISRDMTLVSLNQSKRNKSNSSLNKTYLSAKKGGESSKKKHNRKKSCELILPKLTIENFTTHRIKSKKLPLPTHNTTALNSKNYNQYKYIFEDQMETKYKTRAKRSNSRSGRHCKNSLTNINDKTVTNYDDNVIQDFADLVDRARKK